MSKQKTEEKPAATGADLVPYDPADLHLVVSEKEALLQIHWTSYDLTAPQSRLDLLDIMTVGGDKAEEWINKEFTIAHLTVYPKTYMPNAEGEVITAIWSCITTGDGQYIAFHSQGILDAIRSIISLGGRPPYTSLGKWTIKRKSMGQDKSMYQLQRIKS